MGLPFIFDELLQATYAESKQIPSHDREGVVFEVFQQPREAKNGRHRDVLHA
jgi:hypothetical protein